MCAGKAADTTTLVNLDAEFKHPVIGGLTLRTVSGELIRQHARPERQRGRQREVTPA
jgi:hypothetical protein